MIFILIFVLSFLFNLYVVIFGKQDIQKLKGKLSIQKYLEEINDSINATVGDWAKVFKIVLTLLLLSIILFNAMFFLWCALAVILGTFIAKKAYQNSYTSNIINKIATYINRIR